MNRRDLLRAGVALSALPFLARAADPAPKPIKTILVGTGHSHAGGKLAAMRAQPALFDVVGVVEPDERRRKSAEGRKDYAGLAFLSQEQALGTTGLEAIAVEADVAEQVTAAMPFAQAGIHIHLEKPGGASLPAFRALVGEIRKRERRLQLGYMFRYNPAFRFAFDAARDGLLGKIYEIHGVIGKTVGPAERAETAQFGGGMMFELGCHLIDTVVRLLGVPTKVHAHLRQSQAKPGALADNTLAVLEYPDAVATIRSAGIDVEGGARRQLNVSGNRGAVSIVPLEPPKATLTLAEAKAPYAKGTQKLDLPPMAGRYTAQMAGFAQMIRSSAAPEFDLAHELSVFEAVLKASGMPVE